MWECFRSLGDLYCGRTLCTRWGRDRLGNYPCLMNTKIRIWLKSTEMARQQVLDAPGELWAAQIYPQAFSKMFFFFFCVSIVASFEPRMLLAVKALPQPPDTNALGTAKCPCGPLSFWSCPVSTECGAGSGLHPLPPLPLPASTLIVESSKKNRRIAGRHLVCWKGP